MPAGQLRALDTVGAALDAAGQDWWLFGGWGVDFWVGSVSRDHTDVDLVAWQSERAAVDAVLRAIGGTPGEVDDPGLGAAYELDRCRVELTFLVPSAAGGVSLPFADGPFRWWPEPLGEQRRTLSGVTARVVPRGLLIQDKAGRRGDPSDQAKDAADLRALLG